MELQQLAGCLIPETVGAALLFEPGGAFRFNTDGTIGFALALVQIAERGFLTPGDDKETAKLADDLQRDPGTKSASYKGHGGFQ